MSFLKEPWRRRQTDFLGLAVLHVTRVERRLGLLVISLIVKTVFELAGRSGRLARCFAVALSVSFIPSVSHAEPMSSSFKVFGHIDFQESFDGPELNKDAVSLGESAFFGFVAPTPRLSVTTEVSYLPKRYREKTLKVERFLFRYELSEKLSMSLGKMHTPVSYWNDTFHHGRLMFPTIERPLSFSRFIPIHETGVRLSGRGIGYLNTHFDLVVSSGQKSEGELFANGVRSYTARVGVEPVSGLDLQVAYYANLEAAERVFNFDAPPNSGSGLRIEPHRLSGVSVYWEGPLLTSLTEVAYARFGRSGERSLAAFQYAGFKVSNGLRAYLYADFLDVDAGVFQPADRTQFRTGIGTALRIAPSSDLKLQLEWMDETRFDVESTGLALKIQLAFGF